jgi:hypothetical protein
MRIHVTIVKTGAPWNLTLKQFVQQLAEHRPDALIAVDAENAQPQVRFGLRLGGEQAEGIYCTGDWQQLICWDATIDDWAPIIEWFLGLLPLEAEADIFLEAVAVPQRLPRLARAADIARILTTLDDSVWLQCLRKNGQPVGQP